MSLKNAMTPDRQTNLAAGGEMEALVRGKDWSSTPLGPAEAWSPSLRMMVSFLLANRFPLLLWWGPDYISIYNDAYRPILGDKHPAALGMPFREVWPEVAETLMPLIDAPFSGGPSSWSDHIMLEVRRHGFTEETHFTFAYSPVPDDAVKSGIGGVMATVQEITDRVIGKRRLNVLHELTSLAGSARGADEACAQMTRVLAMHALDLPFALIYLMDEAGGTAHLGGAAGTDPGAAPATIELSGAGGEIWPLGEVARTEASLIVEDLPPRFERVPPGPWSDPPHRALIVPIRSNVAHRLAGFLVAGISSRLALDEAYAGFLDLAAIQIATAIANARAHEEEHKRAEALAAIDRAKTTFFSNISHEFRTPLTLMLGPLNDALADTAERLGPTQRQRIGMAERNGRRLQKLVNTLLDFSRVEAGRMQAVYRPVDLAALTRDLASSFRSACEKGGLTLSIDTPALGEPVFVDRDMWEKIVLNLISNAFKFTLQGGITVKLAVEDRDAVLTVADTGIGIREQDQSRLFDRFQRVEGARGRTHEGTGIGLALVRELVGLHRGTISVRSRIGEGSTFTVRLPLGSGHLPPDRIAPAESGEWGGGAAFVTEAMRWVATDLPPAPGKGGTVLVADDNADMRRYLSQLLAGRYEIATVEDGQAALDAIRERKPDLLLTDIMMPRLDGFALLAEIRADPALRDLPVVLLSARAGEEATVEGLDAGADDYLVKPFTARELIARVTNTLERARSRRQVREIEERFRALVTATSDIVYRMSADWTEMRPIAGRGLLPESEAPIIAWLDDYLLPEDQPQMLDQIKAAIRERKVLKLEHRVRGPGGRVGWVSSRAIPVLDSSGEIIEWFGTATDITERRRTEQHLQLVVNELNHRVRNNLAMIQGIASQTFRNSSDLRQAELNFSARVAALAAANNLLVGDKGVAVSLAGVLDQAVRPHCPESARFRFVGPHTRLSAKTALAFSLAMHELATNALKYGAWAGETGRVDVTWRLLGPLRRKERLHMEWRETGGPAVTPPQRRGFGSRLIERGLAAEMGGTATLHFEPQGLICVIDAPVTLYDEELVTP